MNCKTTISQMAKSFIFTTLKIKNFIYARLFTEQSLLRQQQQPVIWSFRFSLICLRRGRRDNVWMMRSVSPEPGCCRDKSQVFSSSFDIIESIYLWTCERDNNPFGTFIEIWESRIYQIYNVVQFWLCCAALLLELQTKIIRRYVKISQSRRRPLLGLVLSACVFIVS